MNLFYDPDIQLPVHALSPEESRHCVRVLRLVPGDEVLLTDGRGNLHTARITEADPRRCTLTVVDTWTEYGRRGYNLTMAVAPTKNMERYEWFLEKATEVGCDVFIPVESRHSERRVVKHERAVKVVTSAVKQSLKAYHPRLEPVTDFRELIARPFDGVRLIAHCGHAAAERKYIAERIARGDNVMILIGPEGDFSPEEVRMAVENGFGEITLGESRLRTETAALQAVIEVAVANR